MKLVMQCVTPIFPELGSHIYNTEETTYAISNIDYSSEEPKNCSENESRKKINLVHITVDTLSG